MISGITSNNSNFSFKAGYLNILATADNHGKIMELPKVIKCIENNSANIFLNAESKSTLNLFSIVGDWFINPSKTGFITNPNLTNGDVQKWALIRTIDSVKKIIQKQINNLTGGLRYNFSTIYAMGNHCLDAGTNFIVDVMKTCPMKSLITNVDLDKSYKIAQISRNSNDIVKSVEYAIPDDKNPKLNHKVMVLGVTIPSMDYYNPGLCDGLEFYDNSDQKDTALTEEKLQGTINAVKTEVEKFKEANPKGAVILMSHMGENLAEIIIKNVPQIDHVLNGHDHRTTQKYIGKTTISSLGKDNEIIKALNCKFDDYGNFITPSIAQFDINRTVLDGIEELPFQIELKRKFQKDIIPLVKIKDSTQTDNINGSKNIRLSYGDETRYQNSYLMNFLTTAIKEELQKNIDSDIYAVGLQSSIVRCGLENKSDNLTVMKIFDGVSKELSGLEIGTVSGSDFAGMIIENVIDNIINPTRNTLIHWSDVQIDKTLIKSIYDGNSNADYDEAIRVRNPKTQEFEPIDLNNNYKIAIGRKYLLKNSIKYPPKIRKDFKEIGVTYEEMFRKYLEDKNYTINITSNTKEKRII